MMRKRITFLAIILLSALPALALSGDPLGNFRATVRGSGTLEYGRSDRSAVREVKVQFRRSGEAEIQLVGDRTTTLVGRWFNDRSGIVDLEILSGFGGSLSTGRGQMTPQGSSRFSRLEFSGTQHGEPFSLVFNAD